MQFNHAKDLQIRSGEESVKSVSSRRGYGGKYLGKRMKFETRMEVLGEEMWTTADIPLCLYAYASISRPSQAGLDVDLICVIFIRQQNLIVAYGLRGHCAWYTVTIGLPLAHASAIAYRVCL